MSILRGLLGISFFLLVALAMSRDRRRFPWRVVVFGLLMQMLLAWLLIQTSGGRAFFQALADKVTKLISMAEPGAQMVFGPLADPEQMGAIFGEQNRFVFAFAGTGLVALIFFSALMSLLYHIGVMQVVVWLLARCLTFFLGVSGAEAMAMAANIFVGQTEAPLVVKPYIPGMTSSELNALMTGGFATIAGTVLAIYVGFIGPEYGPHLLTASVMSAPAALMIAKIVVPETEVAASAGRVELKIERSSANLIEAATNGISDGLKLWLNVIAMLIGFMALVNFLNWPLGWLGEQLELEGGLSLSVIFGKVFGPVAWLMGVEGWRDCQTLGSLLGTKIAINDFVAFGEMHNITTGIAKQGFEHTRTAAMAAFALCGFANFASIGIQIGGISPLAPERRTEISRLALRAMFGGAFASWLTATVAGMFL